jgi:hypothetical protein
MSFVFTLYTIHNDDDTIFKTQNVREYIFVDFLVYNKYMNMNLAIIDIPVAEYAMKTELLMYGNGRIFLCLFVFFIKIMNSK